MYDFSKYERTHNGAIDMCANIIGCARQNMMPLKALHLTPVYYEWFKSGVQVLMNKPLLENELLEFDGVNIEMGSRYQSKPIVMEYYEQVEA
jgi:hypothetical protein